MESVSKEIIIKSGVYKEDYENVTEKLLSKPVTYDEAITAIEKIIESGVFENVGLQ